MGSLMRKTLFGTQNMVDDAIARIQGYEPLAGPEGYILGFSGGKDSVVILELCRIAGVKFTAIHSLTTIDPPEVVDFVRQVPETTIVRPRKSFFQLLLDKGVPPLRRRRWCCEELKESGNDARLVITGIRWAESARRTKRKLFDTCYRGKGRRLLNPIIDWSDAQVWEFIRSRNLPYCRLYDEGRKRLGCLFCPMSPIRQRIADAERYPKYAAAFRRTFCRLHEQRMTKAPDSVKRWPDGNAMFEWWLTEKTEQPVEGGLFA